MNNQSKRFLEACEKIRNNAAKFVDNDLLESSSDEDEIDDQSLMEKTFSNYEGNDTLNLSKARDVLQDILTSGAVVCLICIESVKRQDKIWSCQNCYCILHLHCIQKWAKDSTQVNENNKREFVSWSCPKCRTDFKYCDRPFQYLCFCGKVENPVFDSWTVPHSCGKTCDKKLKPDCTHKCVLLCHPGPCPPCPKTVLVSCCCSKSENALRRCSDKEWFCGRKCEKRLSCKIHYCDSLCHKGECPPCAKQSKQKCQCGSKTALRPCYDQEWQCERICNKSLKCGNHQCTLLCHKGVCPDCPDSGSRLCPCGKKTVILPCTEIVEPCGDTCDKLLECELHRCSQRCHYGPCEKCLQMRVMRCRCSQREKSVPCCKEFICETKCKQRRDCGRHNCNRKCCIGNCPPCELICGKTINCGRHKCASLCHSGPCFPCREMEEITCNCGNTKIKVPCGSKKSAAPPRCSSDCRLPSDCHHKERQKHKCHFGSCPPCRLICNKLLPCDHSCLSKCHTAVLTKIETKVEGPWDLRNSTKMVLVCKPCPPCGVPVPVTCLGSHETLNFPCHQSSPTSCGRPCGRLLPCGNHECSYECHVVVNENFKKPSRYCEICDKPCGKPRKEGCSHPCPLPCHPGECPPCKQHFKFKCHCQIGVIYKACDEWTTAKENDRNEMLSCKNRCPKEMNCGHRCILPCHAGPCSDQSVCKKKVVLRCPCKRKKKEVQCLLLDETPKLDCDEDCLTYQESLKVSELQKNTKKVDEERKAQEEEYKAYLKKTEGKKKKKKKQLENTESNELPITRIIGTAVIVCVIGFLYYFIFSS